MAERILIVDDSETVRELLVMYAKYEGFDTAEAESGESAVAICRKERFDLIILDVMMPGMDGFSACHAIRTFCSTPILMLTARGEECDRIQGFREGVDDYVQKPFSPRELMLRVEAILKRSRSKQINYRVMESRGITINQDARQVEIDGEVTPLTPKEYDLLLLLIASPGIALTRKYLLDTVWGGQRSQDDRTLDTHIKQLRHALGAHSKRIVTVHSVGYRYDENK